MALSKAIQDFLNNEVSDAAVRQDLSDKFERFPVLQTRFEGNLRQQDYDRQMNESKTKLAELQASHDSMKSHYDDWKKWSDKNVPIHTKLVADHNALLARAAEMEARLAANGNGAAGAGAGAGDLGDLAELDANELAKRIEARVSGMGYARQGDVEKIAAQEAAKMRDEIKQMVEDARKDFVTRMMPGFLQQNAQLAELMQEHRQTYGEKLDWKALSKYAVDHNEPDISKAYEGFTSDKRRDKDREQLRAEVRREVESERMPGTSVGPTPGELGNVERMMRHELPKDLEAAELGSGALAAAAARQLRQEGRT